jgi:hypothetical protein
MASYTTSLRLVQPATGEYSGSWGTQVNNGLTALVDTAVAGTVTITMTAADYTLSNANGAADEARAMVLNLTGAPGAARNVICPAVSKVYIVYNNTTGGFAQTLKTSAGTGISVPNGSTAYLRCDGTNVVAALDYLGSLTVGGNATLNAGTANGVLYLNGSKVATSGSALTFDGTVFALSTTGAQATIRSLANASQTATVQVGGNGNSGGSTSLDLVQDSASNGYLFQRANAPLIFGTNNAEKMRLDSSGNLGLGVTPSAWVGDKALQVIWGSISSGYEYSVNVSSVAYRDNATWRYQVSSQAPARYEQITGQHRWYTAPSGTAGNAISFTQAMTLDASGNLGIGASSPGNRLYVSGPQASPQIRATDGNVDAYIAYSSGTGASAVNYLGTGSNHPQVFITNNVERGRFTIDGDFIVGSNIVSGPNAITFASITNGLALVNNNNAAATGYLFQSFRRSSTEIGSITQNGTTAVLFNTTSDRRLKDNIVPAPSASDVIDAIEIVSHDWKAAPDEHVTYGVIAQDLALVAPQAVLQGDDGEEIEKTWGVDYSKLVPMLIKEIQSLRARVAALEAA